MAFITPERRPGHVYHFVIDDEPYFLSKKDIGQEFVGTRLFNGWLPKDPKESKIRKNTLTLIALQHDGSLVFQGKDEYLQNPFVLPKSSNNGYWMSVEKCVQLFKENSPKIRVLELPMGAPPTYLLS